jgi:hypothetical protein
MVRRAGKAMVLTSIVAMVPLVLGMVFFGCGKASTKPEVKSLEPTSGTAGSEVVISGGTFGSTQGTGVVFFGTEEAEVVSWSDTSITVKVPSDLKPAEYGVTVETDKGASNQVNFEVTQGAANAPKITSLDPESGKSGDEVMVKGSNFGQSEKEGVVLFGTGSAQVVEWSDTSITIKVPDNLGSNTYGVTVQNSAGKSNEAVFKIGDDQQKLSAQKQAVVSYLQAQGQSTAGSDAWMVTLVKTSSEDTNWEVVKVALPDGSSFEAVLIFNNMLGDWECLATGQPPWTGIEFKGEPVPSDIENV